MAAVPDLLDMQSRAPRRHAVRYTTYERVRRDETTPMYGLVAAPSDALCRLDDADENWFPTKGQHPTDVRMLCYGCPLYDPCQQYALNNDVDGIWAGTTERERRQIRKARGIVAKAVSFAPWLRDKP